MDSVFFGGVFCFGCASAKCAILNHCFSCTALLGGTDGFFAINQHEEESLFAGLCLVGACSSSGLDCCLVFAVIPRYSDVPMASVRRALAGLLRGSRFVVAGLSSPMAAGRYGFPWDCLDFVFKKISGLYALVLHLSFHVRCLRKFRWPYKVVSYGLLV